MFNALALPAADDPAEFADLLEQVALHRDRAAFARLFAYFAPRIKGQLLRQGMEPARAEALTEDVMVAVWRNAGRFERRQTTVATWVFRTLRNRLMDVGHPQRRSTPVAAVAKALSPRRLRLVAGAG